MEGVSVFSGSTTFDQTVITGPVGTRLVDRCIAAYIRNDAAT